MNNLSTLRFCLAAVLTALPAAALTAPLTVVAVGAPAINCVFNTTCTITVNDSVGSIAVPGAAGTARLQSRTFTGAAGAPAAGKTGYLYRVDLTQATGVGNIVCVSKLKLDFGPVTKLPYKPGSPPADIYVITAGGVGNVGVASADKAGNVVTITFAKPICPGASAGKGDTSYFFGLTAAKPPKAITAQVQVGAAFVNVAARAPNH